MGLPARQSESAPRAPLRRTEWCESGQHGPRQTTVVTIPQMVAGSLIVARQISFETKFLQGFPFVHVFARRKPLLASMEQMGTGQILSRPKKIDGLLTQKVYAARKR
jgi:hypothetical protein